MARKKGLLMRYAFWAFLAVTIGAAFSLTGRADTITLKDGRTFEGTVVARDSVYTVSAGDKLYQFRSDEVSEHNGKALASAKEVAGSEKPSGAPNPRVKISTDKGDMVVELFEDEAPNTVANMISLAEQGFYKGMSFHRIIPGFMAQGGCPNSKKGATGTPGTGDPGYKFADEFAPGLKHSGRGIVSMANSGPNTNGSQFFICFAPAPHLDGRHTVFGKVVDGLEVLDKLEALGTSTGKPTERVEFNIEVLSKRDHPYTVKKL
jgi:cyclophilin family peptidyl-prolyl cis-trans isomerase